MNRWRRWLLLALGFAISGVFLYLALRGLNLSEVGENLAGAQYVWLIPGVAVYFVAVWARTWRWHYLLRPDQTSEPEDTLSCRRDRLHGQQCVSIPGRRSDPRMGT